MIIFGIGFKFIKNRTYLKELKKHIYKLNNLMKYLPNQKLTNMNREIYQNLLVEYGKKHSKSTVTKFNALVHACVEDAIYDGKLEKDFVKRTKISFNKENERKIDYLNIDELKRLTKLLINTKNKNFTSKYMILLTLCTGMRLGEVQGLTWDDINFNFKTININKTWNSELNKFQPTKNELSKRIIKVNDEILTIIKELKTNKNKQVFTNQYGTIPTSSAVNKVLKNALSDLNINRNGFHFHSLRHSHVAYLMYEGFDIYVISKRLGHSDISTTTRVYSYLIDEYKQQSDEKIEKSIGNLLQTKKENLKKLGSL